MRTCPNLSVYRVLFLPYSKTSSFSVLKKKKSDGIAEFQKFYFELDVRIIKTTHLQAGTLTPLPRARRRAILTACTFTAV